MFIIKSRGQYKVITRIKFNSILKAVSCQCTDKLIDLKCDNGFISLRADQSGIWKFKKRYSRKKPDQIITELWNIEHDGQALDVIIKYSVKPNKMFEDSIVHLRNIREHSSPIINHSVPRVKYIENVGSNDRTSGMPVIIFPYIEGISLRKYLNKNVIDGKEDICKQEDVLISCVNTIKQVHELPLIVKNIDLSPQKLTGSVVLTRRVEAFLMDKFPIRRLLSRIHANKYETVINDIKQYGISYIHRDCFPHNFIIDKNNLACLIDWESLDAGTCLEDLSQFMGSVIMSFIVGGYECDRLERLHDRVMGFYNNRVSDCLSYKIFLLRAIARFSPLTMKHFDVIYPRNSKLNKILNLNYPRIVNNYYAYFRKLLRGIEDVL